MPNPQGQGQSTLRLVVFDLDFTVWQPEMYELSGPPKLIPIPRHCHKTASALLQEARTKTDQHMLADPHDHTPIRVFEGAVHALEEIHRLRQDGHDICAAVASRTDRHDWAHTCLNHLTLSDGVTTLKECFQEFIEIDPYRDKTHHLTRLQQKTNIPFEEMCFFDNEHWNIQCVSKMGVFSIYTPHGMTRAAWEKALQAFGMKGW